MKVLIVFILGCVALGTNAKSLRLTNNDRAADGEFPYQVSIQLDGRHICGGSLIGKKHVLTAAHCTHVFIVQRIDKSRIKIAVGSTKIPGGKLMDVDRIAHHGAYRHSETRPTLVADVSVIRLKEEITESENVKIIKLPKPREEILQGQSLIVSGFGATFLGGPTSPFLKKMTLRAVDRMTCQQSWPMMPLQTGLYCAALAPGYGTCVGDSGGPLTINKEVVVGIVSAGSSVGCGSGTPDLFTKVSYYLDFINSEMALTA